MPENILSTTKQMLKIPSLSYISDKKRNVYKAEEALKQIEEKQYAVPYLDDKREVHKIGVNISGESRTVDEWLEAE